ncbi:helix-turn-helix transcriptional regulator [Patulibacter sp.]|uniref:helix-turn-helix transcriptional regulator n=1 Tax=Patulibacter sp. TaxID=1912859 RepID=UPI00271D412E|nr:LuxR family transcriptional regulator [Patulibacter sp.]MDO9410823.1 AAA family ATPase [Patulibacter sp.]
MSPIPTGSSRLLERDDELETVAAAVAGAGDGRPGLLVIEGPGGIGKTRLLLHARALATAAGVRVLSARGSERERRLPFGVVGQLFAGDAAADEALSAAPVPTAGDRVVDDASFAVLAALARRVEDLAAEGPLLLVVDDLHLCDDPSLQVLGYLARRLERLRTSVLATLRPFERTPSAALLADLTGDPLAVVLRPRPLSDTATGALLTAALGREAAPSFASACRASTGGNPLLLTELVKTLRAERVAPVPGELSAVSALGPRAVLRTVLVRLDGLPAGSGELARAIAVLGDAADPASAAELAGLGPDEARRAASALIGAEILADGPAPRFVHPLVGSAVYEAIPAPERAVAHDRAATLLHDRHGSPGTVAAHLLRTPAAGRAWVCDVLVDAAQASSRAGAPADAVAFLERALAEPPPDDARPGLVLAAGRAAMPVDSAVAEDRLREALRLVDGPEDRALVALDLARLLLFRGQVRESRPVLRDAAAALGPGSEDLRRRLLTVELMASLYDPRVLPTAAGLAAGRELPLPPGIGARMLAAATSRLRAYDGGSAEECAALALAALEDGELVRADSVFLSVTAVLVLDLADRPEADAGWAALLEEGERRGSHASRTAVGLFRGYCLARRGELAAAEASLAGAVESARDWRAAPRTQLHGLAFRSWVLRERGDLHGARAALDDAGAGTEDAADAARLLADADVRLLLADGRFAEALDAARDAARRFAFLAAPIDTPPLLLQAQALDGLGRRDEAIAAATSALDGARAWGAPGVVARALRVLGTVQGDDGLLRLQQAVDVARGTPARLELAKAQVQLGAGLRAAGRPADARVVLREGLELAASAGATLLEARARRELHAAGGRPRKTALHGPAALTTSERRVVERAAAGRTNREIAAELFVTTKTVELHLGNAYRKLGVAGRHGLAAALGG